MTFRNVTAVVVLAAGLGTAAAVAAPKDRVPPRTLPASGCPAPPAPAAKPTEALLSRFGVLREDREAADALPADVVEHLRRRGLDGFDLDAARLLRTGSNGAKAWVVPVPDVRRASAPLFGCLVVDGRGRPPVPPVPGPALVPPSTPTVPGPRRRAGRAPARPAPVPATPSVPSRVPTTPAPSAVPAPRVPTIPAPSVVPAPRVPTIPAPSEVPALRAPRPATVPLRAPLTRAVPVPAPAAVPPTVPWRAPRTRAVPPRPLLVSPMSIVTFPGGQAVAALDPLGDPLEGVVVVTQAGAASGGGGALEDLLKGRAAVSTEPCADGRADLVRVSGLVPDGVDRVFLTTDDGSAVEARPERNGYAFTVPVKRGAARQRYVVWSGADGTPRVQPVVLTRLPKRFACTVAAATAGTIIVGPVGRPLTAIPAGGRRAAARRG